MARRGHVLISVVLRSIALSGKSMLLISPYDKTRQIPMCLHRKHSLHVRFFIVTAKVHMAISKG